LWWRRLHNTGMARMDAERQFRLYRLDQGPGIRVPLGCGRMGKSIGIGLVHMLTVTITVNINIGRYNADFLQIRTSIGVIPHHSASISVPMTRHALTAVKKGSSGQDRLPGKSSGRQSQTIALLRLYSAETRWTKLSNCFSSTSDTAT
jgi:hypothetical protein